MIIDLKKTIDPNSLRGIGQRPSCVRPHELVIAGLSISAIATEMNGCAFQIGGIHQRNAFALMVEQCCFVYVNPKYSGYRRVALKRFEIIHDNHDIDHVLAKTLAEKLNYKYVLISMVFKKPNREHGCIEKFGVTNTRKIYLDKVIFPDERIFHKILSRSPYARQSKDELCGGFDRHKKVEFGLTLKQQGIWNLAFGLDKDTPDTFLSILKKIPT